jgi:hypothetical protein
VNHQPNWLFDLPKYFIIDFFPQFFPPFTSIEREKHFLQANSISEDAQTSEGISEENYAIVLMNRLELIFPSFIIFIFRGKSECERQKGGEFSLFTVKN